MKSSFFQKYLLPGFIFQSVVIAGGYGTGRELVEFFLRRGPLTGLLAMAVATVIWSVVAATSFELARLTQSYDYRIFFKHLLGRGWFLYEIIYFLQVFLVLAVVAAAADAILRETVDGALRSRRAMWRTPAPCALRIAISSRSAKDR